ncbi:MAG TPA: heavy metal-responsive transcriptional regulator [Pyrinomonadaceae bacterium]|nr:heavy metal-responsive transcriptional regulator [Pyrinomonadaceae bacterium]
MAGVRDDSSKKAYVRAGELARAAGVSTDTLRHYERKGVLGRPRRSANGYREYPPEALERVLLVRRALSFGFTLDELARVLRTRERGGAPCREVRALAAGKLEEVESRLRELRALRGELRAILGEWDERLSESADGGRAGLLESLPGRRARAAQTQTPRAPLRRGRGRTERRGTVDEED